MKLWAGRTDGNIDSVADDFNASISFDSRLYTEDITGSMAHAAMLGARHIITADEADRLIAGLQGILDDLDSGKLSVDMGAEDIHTFVEQTLTARVGDVGKKLHTARSRNDQVALDMRLYARGSIDDVVLALKAFVAVICDKAEAYKATIMSGYTHLQRAQPITFGHHLMAYAMMLLRDIDRLGDCRRRLNVSPLGCCALAGTTYDIDRPMVAESLGFDGVCLNSIDGVSDRDYLVEILAALSLVMAHLSRFAEELILWSSWEFGYVRIGDAYTTGSSIMPQKKNADMAELTRGKTGRVYGSLVAMLTVLKGLPLAYNKDMQEDKESVFDAVDTVKACLAVFTPMVATMEAKPEAMLAAAKKGFINATDVADYLAKKGVPFRTAYHAVGQLVEACAAKGKTLDELTLDEYRQCNPLFEADVFDAISLETCVSRRTSLGGTCVQSVEAQIAYVRQQVK